VNRFDALVPPTSIFSGRPLERRERAALAVLIGVAAGLAAALAFLRVPEMLARDFTYPWWGARALLDGQNPYEVIRPRGPAPYDMWFMYPLTAAMAVTPLALLPAPVAGILFTALGAAAFTYVITANGLGRAWVLLSPSFGLAVVLAQWTPLLVAAAFATPLAWALACKPTIGAALFAYRPRVRTAVIVASFVALAFIVQPDWLAEWLRTARTVGGHPAPAFRPLGALALLALLRWRRPEARLVAVLALVPQNLYFYDQLPLWLAARNGRQALLLTVTCWVAAVIVHAQCPVPGSCGAEGERWVILLLYLPAAAIALFDRSSFERIRALVGSRRSPQVQAQRPELQP